MAVTLKQIAEHLGVSQSLVSGVLNDRDGVWVSEENRRRIVRAARELGYRPHAAARALASGKTHTIAFVFVGRQDLPYGGYFFEHPTGVIEVLADLLGRKGYDLLIRTYSPPQGGDIPPGDVAHPSTCDLAVVWGEERVVEQTVFALEADGIPFVAKGYHEESHPHWPQVEFDHEAMMRASVETVIAHGRTRLAYLGFDRDEAFAHRLIQGFSAAIEQLLGTPPRPDFISSAGSTRDSTREQVRRWLSLPEGERPDGYILGGGAATWEGLELTLAEAGLRLGPNPAQISVAGQGNASDPMLFGEGHAFHSVSLAELAREMGERLLLPLLQGDDPDELVLRFLPRLTPKRSWRLDPAPPRTTD